jgi:hypothetical protein
MSAQLPGSEPVVCDLPHGAEAAYGRPMRITVTGEVWHWRGPAPHHFVTVPPAESELIAEVAARVSYGWGMIPVTVTLGGTSTTTSLWPKDGRYIVPLKAALRAAEGVEVGDTVAVELEIAS